jgi:hypothetical protein
LPPLLPPPIADPQLLPHTRERLFASRILVFLSLFWVDQRANFDCLERRRGASTFPRCNLGNFPPGPVKVEIFVSTKHLSQASRFPLFRCFSCSYHSTSPAIGWIMLISRRSRTSDKRSCRLFIEEVPLPTRPPAAMQIGPEKKPRNTQHKPVEICFEEESPRQWRIVFDISSKSVWGRQRAMATEELKVFAPIDVGGGGLSPLIVCVRSHN